MSTTSLAVDRNVLHWKEHMLRHWRRAIEQDMSSCQLAMNLNHLVSDDSKYSGSARHQAIYAEALCDAFEVVREMQKGNGDG